MENIRTQFEKAFFNILDGEPDIKHIRILLDEIIEKLNGLVPSRTDIHAQIRDDLKDIDWELQAKLIRWIEKFQSPNRDIITNSMKEVGPIPIGQFLKQYYKHLETVNRDVWEYRRQILKDRESGTGIPSVF